MTAAVATWQLEKRYPKRPANVVDRVSFWVAPGEIFGLLGPNGAGKTTTVGILTTRIRATGGAAYIHGLDVSRYPVRARMQLAVVPQQNNLDRSLTPRQNLTFHAAYHGFPRRERNRRAAALLDEFGLSDRADERVEHYSGGMAQRLLIARALMHGPRVLFLDEPTAGLDPQARLFLWQRMRELRQRGVTVVLTTHDMEEATDLSDRVGIIDHGRLLALDSPAALVHQLTGLSTLDISVRPASGDRPDAVLSALAGLPRVIRGERVQHEDPAVTGRHHAAVLRLSLADEPAALLGAVTAVLVARSATLLDVRIGVPSLADVFFHLTGRGLR